jgi:hypothetical protein
VLYDADASLQISEESQLSAMYRSFNAVQKQSDIVVLEGTGHTAVGSIVNLNNAQVNTSILSYTMLFLVAIGQPLVVYVYFVSATALNVYIIQYFHLQCNCIPSHANLMRSHLIHPYSSYACVPMYIYIYIYVILILGSTCTEC